MKNWLSRYSMHIYIYFFYTAVAAYSPYLAFWFSEKHLSSQQIGLIFSVSPLVGLFVQPLWAVFCDRYGIEKKVLIFSILMTPVIAFGYLFGTHYSLYLLCAVLLAVMGAPVAPVSDAMTVGHAQKYGQSYGGIRVLGSISFAVAVTPLGILYHHIGIQSIFYAYFIFMLIACSSVFLLDKPAAIQRRSLFSGIRQLFSQRVYLYFLLLIFCTVIGSQFYNVFFGVYLANLGGNVSENIGILNSAAAISELPFFILSSRLIKRFGYPLMLAAGAFAGALRWFILSLEPSLSVLILGQLLNGMTFALFYAAGVNFAYEMSPEGVKTTGQTVFSIVYMNLSNLAASNAGGWVIDHSGFPRLFQTATGVAILGGTGFLLLHRAIQKQKKQPPAVSAGGSVSA